VIPRHVRWRVAYTLPRTRRRLIKSFAICNRKTMAPKGLSSGAQISYGSGRIPTARSNRPATVNVKTNRSRAQLDKERKNWNEQLSCTSLPFSLHPG
jgi:hypothetical protein